MSERKNKILFWSLALLMLVALLIISRDAGISGDEEVHYRHSELVYNYFKTGGEDKSCLDTPKTHLQYYGQLFDNLTTIFCHWFSIEDVYSFRHLMSSLAGWLAIVVAALFAAYLSGWTAAIFTLILFAVSPTFLGHAQNNLKDIPFALAYIASVYYSIKYVFAETKPSRGLSILLVISIGSAIGIRAGGILMVFYLYLFFLLKVVSAYLLEKKIEPTLVFRKFAAIMGLSVAAYLFGLILWPYALQNPVLNPWKSYEVMTKFPTTVRQIYDGQFIWSDFHPWHYLPKYMLITIPIIVFIGILLAILLRGNRLKHDPYKPVKTGLLFLTILFPLVYVIAKDSNLYGSWRHFLFVYPGIVIFSAIGFARLWNKLQKARAKVVTGILFCLLTYSPIRFMIVNYPYFYLYYNQLVGGIKGAYANYETDYYYHSMREGAEWLQTYLAEHRSDSVIIVGGNFPSGWFFRNNPNIKFEYFPYAERSNSNWDYAIVANSYIPPELLKNGAWPPKNAIHTIVVDGVPICAILKRKTHADYWAIQAQRQRDTIKSLVLFDQARQFDSENEMIYYKFAQSLIHVGRVDQAVQVLTESLKINPGYEYALEMMGDIAQGSGEVKQAIEFYRMVIEHNRKFFSVYPKLARLVAPDDLAEARQLLKQCLQMNPSYKPAIRGLADTYRQTHPEVAKKYDELNKSIK